MSFDVRSQMNAQIASTIRQIAADHDMTPDQVLEAARTTLTKARRKAREQDSR